MTNRNGCRGNLILVLAALAVLVGVQTGWAANQDIEQLRQAAEQGHIESQINLGHIYANGGDGVAKDDREAVKWHRMAAEQGDADSAFYLGKIYAYGGVGVAKDSVKAYAWLALASAGSFADEAIERKAERDQLEAEMTSEQIAEAQKLVAEISKRIKSARSE